MSEFEKYNMSEMVQAQSEIKSWAQDNIDTLNEKIKSLGKMVDDENTSELLNSIKDYASYNTSVMNSAVNGFTALYSGMDIAVNAYNDEVGQDFDYEKIQQQMEENTVSINYLKYQNCVLTRDELESHNLEENIKSLERINKTYDSLLKKFNNWNTEHSADLDAASRVISKAKTYIQELSTLSYDSKTGYDFSKVNTNDITLLENDSINEILVAKKYVTKDGKITKKGFKYFKNICTKDYDSVTEKEFLYATRLALYADTPEEVEGLINAGYYDPNPKANGEIKDVRRRPTKCFKEIIATALTVDLMELRNNVENYTDTDWKSLSNNLTSLFAIQSYITKVGYISYDVYVAKLEKDVTVNDATKSYGFEAGSYGIFGEKNMNYGFIGSGNRAESGWEKYRELQGKVDDDRKLFDSLFGFASSATSLAGGGLVKMVSTMFSIYGKAKNFSKTVAAFSKNLSSSDDDINTNIDLNMAIDPNDLKYQYHTNLDLNVIRVDDELFAYPSKNTQGSIDRINTKLDQLRDKGIAVGNDDSADVKKLVENNGFKITSKTVNEENGTTTYKINVEDIKYNDLYTNKKKMDQTMEVYNGLDGLGDFNAE